MRIIKSENTDVIFGLSRLKNVQILIGLAIVLMVIRPVLPEALIRVPDWAILSWDVWLSNFFNFVKDDLGLIYLTRTITAGL